MKVGPIKPLRGVSLVEVIFSIGVIIIGILGVMSVLPLAGRRAQDSVSMSVGAAMGDSIAQEIFSRHWLRNGKLRGITPVDFTTPANNPLNDAAVLTYIDAPRAPFVYTTTTFNLDPTSTNPITPFCIDPLLTRAETTVTLAGDATGFKTNYFPYYKPTHIPTQDPSETGRPQLAETPGALAPLRRLLRVGVLRSPLVSPTPKINLLSASEAFIIGERGDDVRFERPKDRTLPAIIPGVPATGVTGGTSYGTRFGSGTYSWIATVVPEQTRGYATMSVVVIRNRLRDFDIPAILPAPSAERNAVAERLAIVIASNGFIGGAGGMVTIASNLNTVSRMLPGQWVMLSGFTRDLSSSNVNAKVPVHRWYRVASLGGDVVENLTAATWRRDIYLDGSDWDFSSPTLMTIVDGAVSVTNHFVRIDSL